MCMCIYTIYMCIYTIYIYRKIITLEDYTIYQLYSIVTSCAFLHMYIYIYIYIIYPVKVTKVKAAFGGCENWPVSLLFHMIESGLKKEAVEPLTGIFHKNMVNTAQYISVSFHLTTRNSPNVRFYQVSPRFQLSELSPDSGLDLIGSARPDCCRSKIRPRDFSLRAGLMLHPGVKRSDSGHLW